MEFNFTQVIVSVIISSSFVGGVFAAFTKKMWSPEAKNDLAKLGNDFARQLLEDAKSERQELRLTIAELEDVVQENKASITRLKLLAEEKDRVIQELERRMARLAEKISSGEVITLQDIFGEKAPKDIVITKQEAV